MGERTSDDEKRFELNWVQAVAGALAAMSSAVLLSTVGAAGTIIGAALGSVVLTVGSAVYSYYLDASKRRMAAAHAAAFDRVARARAKGRGASAGSVAEAIDAQEDLEEAEEDLQRVESQEAEAESDERAGWGTVLRRLPWKRVLLTALGLFLASMLVILAFELLTGRAVSTYTGGSDDNRRTSIPGLGGTGDQTEPSPGSTSSPTPTGTPTATSTPTAEPETPSTPTREPIAPTPSTPVPATPTVTVTTSVPTTVVPSPTTTAP